jgi:hypothetical protein
MDMKKQDRETMYDRIRKHGENLNKIFNTGIDPVVLCKKLRRIELKAHKLSEDYCNGYITGSTWEVETDKIKKQLDTILHNRGKDISVSVNGDPRGYSLKISDDYIRDNNVSIYRDMGGYGIIAPDFTPREV